MAAVYNGTIAWYTSSARYTAVAAWSNNGGAGTAYSVGNIRKTSAAQTVANARCFVCVVAGTGGTSTDPLTTFTRGAKISDGTVTWQECTGVAALNGDFTNTPTWTQGAKATGGITVALGHVIKDAAGTHIFICTTAGTAGAGSEPTWNVAAPGNTTTDNTVTWTYLGTSFTNWGAPHAYLDNASADTWGGSAVGGVAEAGFKFFVGDDHAETRAAASFTLNGNIAGKDSTNPAQIVCVDHAGSVPPVAADLKDTATISTTGTGTTPNITMQGYFAMYGITFSVASGSSSSNGMEFCADSREKYYEKCNFQMASTGAGAGFSILSAVQYIEFNNCTLKFANAGQRFNSPNGRFLWRDSPNAVDSAGTAPAFLFVASARMEVYLRGLDLSFMNGKTALVDCSSQSILSNFYVMDCKIPAALPLIVIGSLITKNQKYRMSRSDNAAKAYRSEVYDQAGVMTTVTDVVRTGGAVAGTDKFGWKFVTTASAVAGKSLESFASCKWNDTTGADVTVTMYGLINAAAVPKDNEIYVGVNYLGASDVGTSHKSSRSNWLNFTSGANLTADTSAWDSGATSRANSHAYALGDIIKAASNAGRVFFCTTAGTSAASEPGGIATAVDGGTVTDGTAVFRAACRFKMSVVLTSPQPALAGLVQAFVHAAKASTTFYVDPFVELS